MCEHPRIMADGTEAPCRECKQCLEDRIKDWTGRCIAESKTCVAAHVVTLTYGDVVQSVGKDKPLEAVRLTYQDVQGYLKRLRYAGFKFRFFAAGEYGSLKGRAHWHLIIFWQCEPPLSIRIRERYVHQHKAVNLWPFGFSFWDEADAGTVRYCTKYINKDADVSPNAMKRVGMSSQPPLGTEYFRRMAVDYVNHGLVPRNTYYSFPGVVVQSGPNNGKPMRFALRGAAAYRFCSAFARAYTLRHGDENWPWTQLMEAWVDERDRRRRRSQGEPDYSWEALARRMKLEKDERMGKWLQDARRNAETSVAVRKSPSPDVLRNRYREVFRPL